MAAEAIAFTDNDKEFVSKRIYAEKIAYNKTLQGIYENLPGHDSQLELDLEKKYSYPIKENCDRFLFKLDELLSQPGRGILCSAIDKFIDGLNLKPLSEEHYRKLFKNERIN